ncbi:sensor histidine kinase [Romboutsia lituseburensis]|uniref:sensor histidine kinase n=1 Tax=Romboutsia lituseburensis TaxID=1537 RepID=UPI00215A74AD|nr:sensor histidine kinase [Romboutsia lituseburensis]MCR8746887.1 GHKL domain-containing protein [Romboutsia lituseburensis]
MELFISSLACMSVTVLVFTFITHHTFKHKLKIPPTRVYILMYLVFIGFKSLLSHWWHLDLISLSVGEFLNLGFNIVYFYLFYFLVNDSLYKCCLVYIFQLQYTGILYWISSLAVSKYEKFFSVKYYIYVTLFELLLFLITIIPIRNFLDKVVIPALEISNIKIWKFVVLSQLGFFVIKFLAITYIDIESRFSLFYLPIQIFLFIEFFILYYIQFQFIKNVNSNLTLERNSLYIKNQLDLQKNQYEKLSNYICETKALRHDLKHHIAIMKSCIENKKYDQLKKYICQYESNLSYKFNSDLCKNFAINCLLNHYINLCNINNIDMNICVDLPNTINVLDSDLCIIFGNCIENAIEACLNLSKNKFININTKIYFDMIIITIDNSYNGKLKKKDDIFLSSKRDFKYEGIGISSVLQIIKKYDGIIRFNSDNNKFEASIMLHENKI